MSNPPQHTGSNRNGNSNHNVQQRLSTDFKRDDPAGYANGNGPLPVPNGLPHHIPNGTSRHRGTVSMGAFEGPRSPPSTKNTSHVPCKFFKQGQCQAGKACPFSHNIDDTNRNSPCKYFAKGNCKFGAKCALAHILPNGRHVNLPNRPLGGQLPLGGRVDPQLYQKSDPALAHSLLAQQANGAPLPFSHQIPPYADNDLGLQQNFQDNIPAIDTGYTSHPDSKYGSPRDDNRNPISPVAHLSALDAPMPASFDSQGISYYARHGAVAASVPSKFGLESPPSSLPKKATIPTDAVRNLHSSVYGRDARSRGPDLGSSPLGSGDEGFGQRIMHSKRTAKPALMSSSLPRQRLHVPDDEDEFSFSGEEDFLPPSLHDLLTPQEKMRRLSRTEPDSRNIRESLSGIASPADSSSKVGSPAAGSPSRYGAFFARQKEEESRNNNPSAASAFGHVGSPLRNSSLHPLTSPSLRAVKIPSDMSPAFASPPRQSSMSMISQQLARQRISSQTSDSNEYPTSNAKPSNSNPALHPGSARNASSSSSLMNRAISSSGISGTGRIDEEQDGVFSMEEEDDDRKRYNFHASGYAPGKAPEESLGAIGSGKKSDVERYGFWS
ncbi:hypothetical protein ABVK25_002040 [Lepraria finkii]|uniref:C3H1-type domain-containing protein n=1 Tax=Lepraria finkii TaxID=1340010 RepID=A0ABR4BIL0_9LECA